MTAVRQGWLEAALGLLYPPVCQVCNEQRSSAGEGFVCAECRRQVRFILPPFCECCGSPFDGEFSAPFDCFNCRDVDLHFSSARSAVSINGIMLDIIHRYKYRRAAWFEPFLGGLLVEQAVPVLRGGHWDCLVPVPLHPTKQREREFNQAERLARHLSPALGVPVEENLLRRVLPTRTQTQLTRSERAANVKNAFALGNGTSPAGRRVVLVDDVFTTGATTNACARVLRRAGAAEVCVWTVARGG